MAVSFKYGAEAFAMIGIAYGLIKWVGRNVRSLVSDSRVEEAHVEALAASMPAAAADALVRQGIVSAEDLARMTPRGPSRHRCPRLEPPCPRHRGWERPS